MVDLILLTSFAWPFILFFAILGLVLLNFLWKYFLKTFSKESYRSQLAFLISIACHAFVLFILYITKFFDKILKIESPGTLIAHSLVITLFYYLMIVLAIASVMFPPSIIIRIAVKIIDAVVIMPIKNLQKK